MLSYEDPPQGMDTIWSGKLAAGIDKIVGIRATDPSGVADRRYRLVALTRTNSIIRVYQYDDYAPF